MEHKNSGEAEDRNVQSGQKGVAVGGDATRNIFITGDGHTINMGEPKSKDARQENSQRKSLKRSKRNKPKRKWNVAVVVALIGLVGVISSAFLTSPVVERLLFSTSAPSPASTISVSETPTLSQPSPATETPVVLPTDTLTPVAVASPTQQAEEKMTVMFFGNPLDGKGPMRVNFNARESFVTLPDGSSIMCGTTRLCHYTFKIMLNDKIVEEDENTDGLYSYMFGKRGQYIVTVYVCRDDTCGGSRVMVNVR